MLQWCVWPLISSRPHIIFWLILSCVSYPYLWWWPLWRNWGSGTSCGTSVARSWFLLPLIKGRKRSRQNWEKLRPTGRVYKTNTVICHLITINHCFLHYWLVCLRQTMFIGNIPVFHVQSHDKYLKTYLLTYSLLLLRIFSQNISVIQVVVWLLNLYLTTTVNCPSVWMWEWTFVVCLSALARR